MSNRLKAPAILLSLAFAGCVAGEPDVEDAAEPTAEHAEALTSRPPSARTAAVNVQLVPRSGVSGSTRVSFAVPLPRGLLTNASQVRVLRSGTELGTARRALALHPDGSVRSVQIQFDLSISGETSVEVRIGEAPTAAGINSVPVTNTLMDANGTQVPRVWAVIPPAWLSASGAFGPLVTSASVAGTPLAAWDERCDYEANDFDAWQAEKSDGAVWLYDRGTTMYRGYARSGSRTALYSAYRETSIYRAGITGTGASTLNPVPGKSNDLKYFYSQNLAIHYLLTGDERFRESAEQIGYKLSVMWDPWYDGGFWTERHAGFALLGSLWASIVSDDRAAEMRAIADNIVDAALQAQASNPPGYSDQNARCFAHTAQAHGEDFGYWGCSPWMSAILADGLDQYATERGGARATAARQSIVKLGRMIAQQGRDGSGKPYYWMGVNTNQDEVDPYHEHWGEAAYVVGMAWYHGGKQEAALKTAADQLVQGFRNNGDAPHLRSFNWQCRSAVAAPYFLKP